MDKFGGEPYEDLLYCVKVAKIVESNEGITRDRISELLKPKQDSDSSLDINAFKLLVHLGWIEKKDNGEFFWADISNHYSKKLWESDAIKTEKVSQSNLQFGCWALLASLKNYLPLPQVISILIEKNMWIINYVNNDPFFVSLRNKFASQSVDGIELFQTRTNAKYNALFKNLNYLGLTRPLNRIKGQHFVHFEVPPEVTFFLLENLIFTSDEDASVEKILEVFDDAFGIIFDKSQVPTALGNSIFELKVRQKISTTAVSSETHAYRIKNPKNYREQPLHLSHVRYYG